MLLFFPPTKALPYVALLIAMLFFIYAVIGMQVIASPNCKPAVRNPAAFTDAQICGILKIC